MDHRIHNLKHNKYVLLCNRISQTYKLKAPITSYLNFANILQDQINQSKFNAPEGNFGRVDHISNTTTQM